MIKFSNVFFALLVMAAFSSCGEDETPPIDTNSTLTLSLTGLEDLGADYAYEGWIMVDGAPKTTGVFNVDANGNPDQTTFSLAKEDLDAATAFILTIEPSPDSDPAPSAVHILAGDFSGTNAGLTVDHSAALGNDFSTAAGKYILATPTDGTMDDENSGVWFLSLASGMPAPALELPTLPAGWNYEGWAVIDGTPVSTGTFTDGAKADDAAPFSGTAADAPPFPGEDFLNNAPGALSFPTDLSETTVVISIEPSPDNSANPFLLKPLVANVPANAKDHETYDMGNNAGGSNPVGTAAR